MGLDAEQFLMNTRSRRLPALWVGEEDYWERSKEWSSGRPSVGERTDRDGEITHNN